MAGKIRLIGAVGIKVRPDTTEFKKELREQIKSLPDYDIEVNVDADTTIAKRKLEKVKADAEKNSIKLTLDDGVFDDLQNAQRQIKKAIASLSQETITVGLDSKELEAKLKELERKARGAKVTMEYNDDKAGYEAILAKIRTIHRQKMVKEITFKTDNKSLAAEARKYEKLLADLAPAKTITITHRNDHESLSKAVATIDEALAKLKEVTITPEMDEGKLLAQKASLQKKLAAKPLVMKVNEDKASYEAVLAKVTALQNQAAATEFKFKVDEQGLITAATKLRAKIAALTPKPEITFTYENDTRGMNGALDEVEKRLKDLSRLKLTAELDEAGLIKARDELELALSTSSFGIDVDSSDLDALKNERKKLEEMLKVYAIQDVSINVENTPESMEEAKRQLDELIKQREAPIKASPLTFEAMAELAYASRTRDVPFYVRINQRSLAIAEGILQSLAGINVLQSTGRQLEKLVTDFDRISIKTGALSALIGGLADTFIYLTTALFPVGEGILEVVGLLAMAPAALAAVTATAVINIAAWQNFGDAVDGSAEALAKLPAEAQKTALALRGTWTEMQKPIQANFWKGMGDSMATSFQAFLPVVTEGLSSAAEHVGRFGAGVFRAMEKVALSGDLQTMFANLSSMFDNAAGAAEPLFDAINRIGLRGSEYLPRFGEWLTELTTRFDAWIKKADEAGQINVWIEQGVQSLKDMWTLGGGIVKMFQGIGMAAKAAGAGGLGDVAQRFSEIGDMMMGEPFQSRLGTIFNGARAGASALNVGVKELGVTLGESALFVGNLLSELGKLGGGALSGLSQMLGNITFQTGILSGVQSLNGMVVTLHSGFYDLGSVIGNMSRIAGAAFTSIAPIINQVIELLNVVVGTLADTFIATIPSLMGLVGGLITSLSGPITLAAGALKLLLDGINSLPGPIQSAALALITFLLLAGKIGPMFAMRPGGLMEKIRYDINQADTARAKFATGMKGLGAGALAAVGGPWGLAIGAIVGGLALFGAAQADATRKVQTLTDAIMSQDQANINSQIYKMWSEIDSGPMDNFFRSGINGWSENRKAANEAANSIGYDTKRITEAIAAGKGKTMADDFDTLSKAAARFPPTAAELEAAAGRLGITMNAQQIKDHAGDFDVLGFKVEETANHFGTGTFKAGEMGAQLASMPVDTATQRITDFNTAMGVYNDKTASADSRTRALKSALDALNGKQPSVEEAQLKLNDAMRAANGEATMLNGNMVQTGGVFRDAEGNLLNFNGVIDATTGKIDTAGTAGANLYRNLQTATDGVLETATAMKDAGEPIESISKFLDDSRAAYVKQAEQAGLSATDVEKAYDRMVGANPKDLVTTISAVGMQEAAGKVMDFKGTLDEIDGYRAVAQLAGDNTVLGLRLAESYTSLADWDRAMGVATAGLDPTQADATKKRLTDDLIILAGTNPTVKAMMDPAIFDQRMNDAYARLRDLQNQKPSPQVQANIQAALDEIARLERHINGRKPVMGVLIAPDESSMGAFESRLRASGIWKGADGGLILPGQHVSNAMFSLQQFANGGFFGGRPVKAFANGGMENHTAQIARGATPYRVWAEPETGGEAYIPLASAKRGRSTQILEQVAKQFGYSLTKAQAFSEGGVVNGGNAKATSGLQVHIDTFNQNANDTIDDVGRGIMRQARSAGLSGILDGI